MESDPQWYWTPEFRPLGRHERLRAPTGTRQPYTAIVVSFHDLLSATGCSCRHQVGVQCFDDHFLDIGPKEPAHIRFCGAQSKTGCPAPNLNHRCSSAGRTNCKRRDSRCQNRSASTNLTVRYCCTQQYSITALTDLSGAVKERYAYDAYGGPSIFDASGIARTSTAEGNRITFTGREWDHELELYHYRARMYDATCGRFVGRDPMGYVDGYSVYQYYASTSQTDPTGLTKKRESQFSCRADPGCGCSGTISAPQYDLDTWDSIVRGPEALVGVRLKLKFTPDDGKSCSCDKIGFIQVAEAQPGPWVDRSRVGVLPKN